MGHFAPDVNSEIVDEMRGIHPEYVFTYRGRRILKMNGHASRKARTRAGLPEVHVHDSGGTGDILLFTSVRGRPRGRSANSRPMRTVVVILVKHILPRVAAVQSVLANPSDGSSCGSRHSTMLP